MNIGGIDQSSSSQQEGDGWRFYLHDGAKEKKYVIVVSVAGKMILSDWVEPDKPALLFLYKNLTLIRKKQTNNVIKYVRVSGLE